MRTLVEDNTDEKTYLINKQEFPFLVGLDVVARQTEVALRTGKG